MKTDFSDTLIVTDLDGTFLGRDGKPVPRSLEALERFRAGGGIFTVATGRTRANIKSALPDPAKLLSGPMVMCNGAYLYDFTAERAFAEFPLPDALRPRILAFCRAEAAGVSFRACARHAVRWEREGIWVDRDRRYFEPAYVAVSAPAEAWPDEPWDKFVFRDEDPAVLEALRPKLAAWFGDEIGVITAGARILELMHPEATKAKGIARLRTLLHAEARTVIACGDFENDLEMLRAADIAVAPANAMPAVKETADAVLCDCGEGLLADVVERLAAGALPHSDRT